MAQKCPVCLHMVGQAIGCKGRVIRFADGTKLEPVPYGEEESHGWAAFEHRPVTGCDDCGVAPGQPHHPGCPVEDCPRCREQYLSCGCETVEKVKLAESGLPIQQ